MNKLKNNLALLATIIAIFGSLFGGYAYIDSRYALAAEVKELETRLTLKELKDLYKEGLDNLYFFRKQSRKYPGDEEVAKKLKAAQDECDLLKKQITAITSGESNE